MDLGASGKRELIGAAIEGMGRAYAPYSGFAVGAALLCADGSVYTGANIENASYPASICAERSAFSRAICDGRRDFLAIAICGGAGGEIGGYCAPCGICRQVMREFCDPRAFLVIMAKSPDDYREMTLEELLPFSFGPESLGG